MAGKIGETAGFSLTGLLMTLALAAVMVGMAAPSYLDLLPRHRLNGAARQVVGDLMWARMKAVQRNNRFRVFFLSDHEYRILDDTDNDNEVDSGEWTVTRDLSAEYRDVVMSANNSPIFSPRGTASSLATITLANDAGSKRITISIAGRVRVR